MNSRYYNYPSSDEDEYPYSDEYLSSYEDDDPYLDEYKRPPPARKASVCKKSFLNSALTPVSKNVNIEELSIPEKQDNMLCARMILMSGTGQYWIKGYSKNKDCVLLQLPLEIVKLIIKLVEGLTAKHYREYKSLLKETPKNGFSASYHEGDIILCKPNFT